MFKKKKIALGVAAGLVGLAGIMSSAQAVHINNDGTGQALLFPYFNAQEGYVTNINLINSTDETKAVRIRFREGKESKDVLDFNLYMSPEDVWTGSIKMDTSTGTPMGSVTTTDHTCALPALASCKDGKCSVTEPFDGYEYYSGLSPSDTLEGYVEVIEMGVVTDSTVQYGVLHQRGEPNNCGVIADAWYRNTFSTGKGAAAKGLGAPTGGLMGSSAILNVPEGTAFAVDPIAFENYTAEAHHTRPDDTKNFDLPSLASGTITTSEIMVKKDDGTVDMVVTDWKKYHHPNGTIGDACLLDNDPKTPACGDNPYPVAHALLASNIMNEYFLDPTDGYDGHTDWVVTFPMRKLGVFNQDGITQLTKTELKNDAGYPTGEYVCVTSTGEEYPMEDVNPDCKLYGDVQVAFGEEIFDREEGRVKDANFSPYSAYPRVLEREVNVLSFISTDPSYDDSRTVLSSDHTLPEGKAHADLGGLDVDDFVFTDAFVSGWARMRFPAWYNLSAWVDDINVYGAAPDSYYSDSFIYQGVPAAGFAAIEGNVSQNAGARFGDAIPHKVQR
ncbi:MAG: hypothetical protein R3F02_04680 [Thiolinea sp.]